MKLFGRNKSEEIYDEDEFYEDSEGSYEYEDEYYEENPEDVTYGLDAYEEGEYAETYEEGAEDEYYAEGEEGEGYYGDEDGEYYEDEAPEGEYYEDEVYEDEAFDEASDVEYMNSDDEAFILEYDEDDETATGFFGKIGEFLMNMTTMDRVVALTGVLVIALLVLAGALLLHGTKNTKVNKDYSSVGTQLDGIETIGGKGLIAVDEAVAARFVVDEVEDENAGYDEEDYNANVVVVMNLTSVLKDLKIKFNNKSSGKLVANVPFEVTVEFSDGTKETWKDDDMDGIIYKKGIKTGKCKVTLNELDGEKYERFTLPLDTKTIEVKSEIAYEKIDVSDEVKTEAEIDVAKEDTAANDTVVESKLTDTVEWVASTQTADNYVQVLKTDLVDPMKVALAKKFFRIAELNENTISGNEDGNQGGNEGGNGSEGGESGSGSGEAGGDPVQDTVVNTITLSKTSSSLEVGATETLTAVTKNAADTELTGKTITWSSDKTDVATVSESGVVTALKAGTAKITATCEGKTAECTVTVTASHSAFTIDINPATVNVAKDGTVKVKVTPTGATEGEELTYSVTPSSNEYFNATIDQTKGEITIKGLKLTTAAQSVTISANYKEGTQITAPTKILNITVVDKYAIALDKKTATAFVGVEDAEKLVLTATLTNVTVANTPVKAKSSDESVATVTVSGTNKVIVTALKTSANPIDITVSYKEEGGEEVSEVCKVTVKDNPKNDKTTKLLTKDGEQVYVLENGQYREATNADYYTASAFYLKGEIKYTGWQTIKGNVYFFDKNGKKVTGEQVIQGAKYTFASDGSLVLGNGAMGIDVSKWNGSIDWKAVKNSGISYVIIRCGYRGSSAGSLIVDPKFTQNIKGATSAGLKVGVYFFTQAIDEVEAVEEASFVLDQIKGYKISYPVFLDVEGSGGRGDKISKETRTAVIKTFCETIKRGGYTPGVYANKTWLNEKMNASQLSAYKIWLAQYASAPTYTGRYDLWQYSSKGKVSGISGDVDLDWSYLGY
ncbi:MAG: Ig-like domain-containing protein [Acetatifactor sp.]|nr:Ig-like domain-containing protein [Acetatifactor sp.]